MNVEECTKKWKNLCDHFVREQKKRSGDAELAFVLLAILRSFVTCTWHCSTQSAQCINWLRVMLLLLLLLFRYMYILFQQIFSNFGETTETALDSTKARGGCWQWTGRQVYTWLLEYLYDFIYIHFVCLFFISWLWIQVHPSPPLLITVLLHPGLPCLTTYVAPSRSALPGTQYISQVQQPLNKRRWVRRGGRTPHQENAWLTRDGDTAREGNCRKNAAQKNPEMLYVLEVHAVVDKLNKMTFRQDAMT